ncbi:hypothetical protein B0H13DRAFT_525995 [Mycena leptocephala]|nr:hypothetical protein B0H13DRAFT_525995 [Mycena leptocephala]
MKNILVFGLVLVPLLANALPAPKHVRQFTSGGGVVSGQTEEKPAQGRRQFTSGGALYRDKQRKSLHWAEGNLPPAGALYRDKQRKSLHRGEGNLPPAGALYLDKQVEWGFTLAGNEVISSLYAELVGFVMPVFVREKGCSGSYDLSSWIPRNK